MVTSRTYVATLLRRPCASEARLFAPTRSKPRRADALDRGRARRDSQMAISESRPKVAAERYLQPALSWSHVRARRHRG